MKVLFLVKNIILIFIFLLFFFKASAYESNTVKIAYYENFYPLSYTKFHELKGILVDSARYIFEHEIKIKLKSDGFPWGRAQEYVKKGEYDAHITVYSEERNKFLLFNKTPVFSSYLVIIYSAKNPNVNEIEKIKSKEDMKKFVINDYIGNGLMNDKYPESEGFKISLSSNIENSFKKLIINRGDIIITNSALADVLTHNHSNKELKQMKIDFLLPKLDYLFCIRRSYPEAEKIVSLFEKGLKKALKNNKLKKIIQYYRDKPDL